MKKYFVFKSIILLCIMVNGDQNGDGHITSGDVTAVYDILLGS